MLGSIDKESDSRIWRRIRRHRVGRRHHWFLLEKCFWTFEDVVVTLQIVIPSLKIQILNLVQKESKIYLPIDSFRLMLDVQLEFRHFSLMLCWHAELEQR